MEETKKIGFFKRVKMSIFDLEKYTIFLNEKLSIALKYFLKLLLILVAIFSITTTVQFVQRIDVLFNYVKNEFPNFEYKDGTLSVDSFVNAYDKTYDAKLIVDTGDVAEEKITEYNDLAEENGISAVMLKDKIFIRANGVSAELKYSELLNSTGITSLTKETVVNKYNESGFMFQIGISIFLYSFMVLYVEYLLVVLENILIVALFGWIASKVIGIKLKFSKAFAIAIYGLTLSNLINILYSIIASFTTFEIKYFSLMYFIIGYIYMMAVIFMNKADIIEANKKSKENDEKEDNEVSENKSENIEIEASKMVDNIVDEIEEKNLEEQDNPIQNKKTVKNRKRKNNKDIKNEDNNK